MSAADWAGLAGGVGGTFMLIASSVVGFLLRQLLNDMSQRLERIERDVSRLATRHDTALTAQADLIREGFELAAKERHEVASSLAFIAGSLGLSPATLRGT